MGFLLKFLFFFVAAYLLLKAFVGFLFVKRSNQSPPRPQQRASQPKQPETQEERIIEYQKKTFEKSEAEDVDFVEIKSHTGKE